MKKVLLFIILMSTGFVFSQNKSFWTKEAIKSAVSIKASKQALPKTQTFTLDVAGLKQVLIQSPKREEFRRQSSVIVSFPNSEGIMERFRIFEASNFHPDLQARYPDIRSYAGQGIDDPSAIIRFSMSPLGFQSMRLSANSPATFIESISEDGQLYAAFDRAERRNMQNQFECEISASLNQQVIDSSSMMRNADDSILRTYRLAVSATGEYTQYHGGTKAQALAAINNTMTRVNGIFEVDFNVTMILIANTDDVIYTSTSSDPYGNTTSGYNSALQNTLTSVIGEANYDVGHLFANLQNNGNAGCIGCVCVNGQKGSGWTSATVPEGDFFDVDYVAHELGHQFGANHTWTFAGNEGTNVQVEPGSGTTIMSYAGITGSTDVEQNVTPNFHAVSIEQVTDYIKTTSCQINTNTGNAVPSVNAGANYTIPRGTAFVLDGSATDTDTPSNQLSYVWEQMDENNASSTLPSTTATSGVAFRAYEPTSDTFRYFPRLSTIKTGGTSWQWEAVPNVARTLNFRLTVRDNVVGGGTNNSDDMVVTVNGTAGPFVLNSPNTNVTWDAGTTQTVTWNVAGTTGNGVNAANVDIFLSTDGGDTYPISLASGVTNDGSHDIVVPNNQGNQNRVMVRGANNIFFDISNSNFTIGAPVVCNADVPTGLTASNVAETSATLSWDAVPGASYDLRYRQTGTSTWTTNGVIGISSNISGLTALTEYEAQVRSECLDTSVSAFSSSVNFTTTNICVPTSSNFNSNTLNHSGTGSTGTTLSFTSGTHEDVSFTVSELNARTGGKQSRRFIDRVVVSYVDGNGTSQNFGTFTGNTTSSVNVSIPGIVQSVTVALSDAFDGNAGTNMSITLGSVQSCVTLNCTDSDGDGVCDEDDVCSDLDDNLIGTSCDDGDSCTINDVYGPDCNCAGTFADSDGDGVCDGDDICPGGDDTIDVDGNGIPDACDVGDCTNGTGNFSPSVLNGSSSTTFSFSNLSRDVSFTISGLDARINGNPRNRFEEVATVTYVDGNGQTQQFNSYSGANQSTANVSISDLMSEVTVSLSNGVSGSSTSISISLSSISFCAQNSRAITNERNTLESNTQIKDFTVFPNPATTELNIRFGLGTTNNNAIDVNLNIYDLTGKVVKRQNWSSLTNSVFERQINISSLESGIYLIGLESSNGGRAFSKLIKN